MVSEQAVWLAVNRYGVSQINLLRHEHHEFGTEWELEAK